MIKRLITKFFCFDYKYKNRHTTGSLVTFKDFCIGYLIKGRCEFLYEGKTYTATPGDLIFISKNTRYYSLWTGEPDIHFYSINFSFSSNEFLEKYPFQIIKNIEDENLHKIMSCYNEGSIKSVGLFYIFLDDLLSKLKQGKKESVANLLLPALSYIYENHTDNIKISHLASLCCISESHFYNKFKKNMGCTPIEYKNNLTIQKALDMLVNSDKTIEEISYELGFSTPSYFRRIFKNIVGKTPKEIRK